MIIQPVQVPDDYLPVAHTCFNLLDLPVRYSNKSKLAEKLKNAIENAEGFGLVWEVIQLVWEIFTPGSIVLLCSHSILTNSSVAQLFLVTTKESFFPIFYTHTVKLQHTLPIFLLLA